MGGNPKQKMGKYLKKNEGKIEKGHKTKKKIIKKMLEKGKKR